jgi:hypothetical protein
MSNDNNGRVNDSFLTDEIGPHDLTSTLKSSVLLLTINSNLYTTQRPVYNQKKYQQEFARTSEDKYNKKDHISNRIKSFLSLLHPRHLLNIFTIVNFIVDYDFKKNFLADVFSGITGK